MKKKYALRCAMCGKLETANDKNTLAKTAQTNGWKRIPLMKYGEVKNKVPVCPVCLKQNPTVEMFGVTEKVTQ